MTSTDRMTAALGDLLGGNMGEMLAGIFERMEWAEDEITAAQKRHPEMADLIYHGFKLLTPTHELLSTGAEFAYRAHCRELLERVAAGQDTRPGTAAEVACQCHDASLVCPLTETASGLYARMWQQAFPGQGDQWDASHGHYEGLHAAQIDDLERESRRKLTVSDRRIDAECAGMHHGEQVKCRLVPAQRTLSDVA
jgi:hypothetical protein